VGIVATVLLAEGLLRIPAVAEAVPERNPYYHGGVQERIDALEALQAESDIDVLFIGSSVVRSNVSPHAFDDEVSVALGRPITSFNVGGSGLHPDSVRLLYERLWSELVQPGYVIEFVRYAELRSDKTAQEFFAGSDIERAWAEGGIAGSTRSFLQEHSALYRRRGVLATWLSHEKPPKGYKIDDRGHSESKPSLSEALATRDHSDIAGYEAIASGYGDPLDEETFTTGLAVLERTAEVVEDSGSIYVIANMPEYPEKFLAAPDGEERYQFYLDTLEEFARERGIVFLDVTGGDVNEYGAMELYSDYHHFTETGATRLSKELALAFAITFG